MIDDFPQTYPQVNEPLVSPMASQVFGKSGYNLVRYDLLELVIVETSVAHIERVEHAST